MKCLNINEEIINSDRSDSTQTKNSSTRKNSDSKDNSIECNGFLGENKFPKNIYENEKDNCLTLEIKNALNKMRYELSFNEKMALKSPLFNYYCNN